MSHLTSKERRGKVDIRFTSAVETYRVSQQGAAPLQPKPGTAPCTRRDIWITDMKALVR